MLVTACVRNLEVAESHTHTRTHTRTHAHTVLMWMSTRTLHSTQLTTHSVRLESTLHCTSLVYSVSFPHSQSSSLKYTDLIYYTW